MADDPGTLEQLAQEFGMALAPLEVLLAPENFSTLLIELGLDTPPELQADATFLQKLSDVIDQVVALGPELENIAVAVEAGNDDDLISAVSKLLATILQMASTLDALAVDFKRAAAGLMDASALEAFVEEMVSRIFENILVRYLESTYPRLWQVLALITIVEYVSFDVVTDNDLVTVLRRRLHFDRIAALLSNPLDLLQQGYGWGTEQFDGKALLSQFSDAFEAFQRLADYAEVSDDGTPSFDLFALKFGPTTNSHPPGVQAKLFIDLPSTTDLTLGQVGDNWRVAFQFSTALAAGLIFRILPPTRVELDADATLAGNAALVLIGQAPNQNSSFVLLGQTSGSSLQATKVEAGVVGAFKWDAASNNVSADVGYQAKFVGGKLRIDLSSADGFVTSVSPQGGFQAAFDFTVGWSTLRGFYFDGGASSEIILPLHISLGPIALQLLYLDLGVAGDALTATASLAANVKLGPVSVTIDRVGASSKLAFQRGNLGPVDLSIAFKPPSGLGIAIDAGVVAGGGYISFDAEKGQYSGVLDVSLAEIIQVKIIAVLDTKLPDGSKGFAFLLIITFDFPPIELGFGFTLNGVGGLGGVNRTMNTDALHAGFRAHTLNNVLFPPDPIANAPQIISSIESFFPAAEGRYLFGPMLEIGWGTPTLITLAVGVILEVPDPIRLVLLGLIDAGLPTTEAALIELHIDVLGILDFGAKTLSIDGSLYDSRVLIFSLAGDLALRLSWGDNPNFVFSLGGFNPHFNTAGLDVPNLHRLSVSIGDGDNPRISANSYFAVTSNSVQFGANVEAYASAAGFSIHGYLGYDVLIIISPFSFEFDFSAGFDVSFEGTSLCGLQVDGLFSGPRPWHLHGDASINILFFSVSVSLDVSWGDNTPAVLPQKPVLPDLLPALADPRNWNAVLPANATMAAALSAPKPDDQTLRVHPLGVLSVREKVVPLDLQITRYGNATPSDGNYFSISDVVINTTDEAKQPIQDYFAAGQFLTLSDADKVSAPSFEKYGAGVSIGSGDIVTGSDSPRTVVYEERYIDDFNAFSRFGRYYAMPADIHLALARNGAGFASTLKNSGMFKYDTGVTGSAVKLADTNYVVTHVEDLSVRGDILTSTGSTFFEARSALSSYLAEHPEETGNLQIQALHEVAA